MIMKYVRGSQYSDIKEGHTEGLTEKSFIITKHMDIIYWRANEASKILSGLFNRESRYIHTCMCVS